MPWIINVCRDDVKHGKHPISDHCMLIQIADPPGDFPEPKHKFTEVHQFQFLDVEEDTEVLDEEMRCSHEQANELVQLLQQHPERNGCCCALFHGLGEEWSCSINWWEAWFWIYWTWTRNQWLCIQPNVGSNRSFVSNTNSGIWCWLNQLTEL